MGPTGSGSLPVMETFHSLQGEGLHSGRSAFFIRLAGCAVGCRWCDTKSSWPEAAHPRVAVRELAAQVSQAAAEGAAFVVITGGEPLHHDLSQLTGALRAVTETASAASLPLHLPLPLHLETSGVDRLSGTFDWITLSPKRHRPPTPALLAACHELKVVVHEPDDLVFAQAMAAASGAHRSASGQRDVALLLQPGHACQQGQRLAIEFVQTHPAWRLSLQTHKLLGLR
ncbi:MAG: 7-carboxy-7-deazaguanine synthase QueE [Cyanobacteriota bacterium]